MSNKQYRLLQRTYSYDHSGLLPQTEAVRKTASGWSFERITFNAAYGHQRVPAMLYLPKNARAPYQVVVYAPAGHSRIVQEIDEQEIGRFDFLLRTGRAVLFPIVQGTYERRRNGTVTRLNRDETIQACQDLQRSLDYLETRPDVAGDRIGLFALSAGAQIGLIALAQDNRIRAAVLAEAGLASGDRPPEMDEVNFASRVSIPVLMLNGRDDFQRPVETSQMPLYRLLGTPVRDKRHVLFDSGHMGKIQEYVKETLEWLDRYLGPVARP